MGKKILISGGFGLLAQQLIPELMKEANEICIISRKDKRTSKHKQLKFIQIDMSKRISKTDLMYIGEYSPDIFIDLVGAHGCIDASYKLNSEDFDSAFNINFFSFIDIVNSIMNPMIENNFGRILSFSGGGVTSPRPYFSPYACSKIAKYKYIENLSEEISEKKKNIKVNYIAPGIMFSNLLKDGLSSGFISKNEKEKIDNTKDNQDIIFSKNITLIKKLISDNLDISGRLISSQWDDFEIFSKKSTNESDLGRLIRKN